MVHFSLKFLFICGDISPLDIQENIDLCELWFKNIFIPWVNNLPVQKVFLIGGNHDFFLDKLGVCKIRDIILDSPVQFKLVYLCDSLYIWNEWSIYGCPHVIDMHGWAFNSEFPYKEFKQIPDCDILLTHTPPKIGEIGRSLISLWDWGTLQLNKVLQSKKIKYLFCGHVHDGDHRLLKYNDTYLKNVAYKNDDYIPGYEITYLELPINENEQENYSIARAAGEWQINVRPISSEGEPDICSGQSG